MGNSNITTTDLEILDAMFTFLKNDLYGILYVQPKDFGFKREELSYYETLIKKTGFVNDINEHTNGRPAFRLNDEGIIFAKEYDRYSAYYNQRQVELSAANEKKENLENLQLQKLMSENQKLVNDLIDYQTIKRQRNILFWVSILSLILLFVKYISGKP